MHGSAGNILYLLSSPLCYVHQTVDVQIQPVLYALHVLRQVIVAE